MEPLTLGIETSCDETAAAVLRGDRTILSSVVAAQMDVHAPYGGIVPELASRRQIEMIQPVLTAALARAGVGLDDLSGVAVTVGPGLVGSLLVGVSAGKALAYARGLPLVGVNHLEGHIYAALLENPDLDWPFVALVISGGHTHLFQCRAPGEYKLLGQTRDDAAGEAFDKVSKLLGLGFPGGPVIERLAREGDARAIPFPRAVLEPAGWDFSFSGLKTAVAHFLKTQGSPDPAGRPWGGERTPGPRSPSLGPQLLRDVCASFQQAVVDMVVKTACSATRALRAGRLVVAGGVACNGALRSALAARAAEDDVALFTPSPALCTDNAAMIAAAGQARLERGERAGLDLNAHAALPLT